MASTRPTPSIPYGVSLLYVPSSDFGPSLRLPPTVCQQISTYDFVMRDVKESARQGLVLD